MDKKDKTPEQIKREEALAESGKEYRFTSENQPSPEAKSEGNKRHWEYRKMRQMFAEALTTIKMPDGKEENFWERAAQKIQAQVFGKDSKLKDTYKVYIIMKLLQSLPKDDKMTIDFNNPPKVLVEIIKTKLEEEDKEGNE